MRKRILKVIAFLSLYSIFSLNFYFATADDLEKIRQRAIVENTYYFENTYCHGVGVNAELQELVGTVWKKVAPALGWIRVAECYADVPVAPWTKADVAEGTQLRWRVWSENNFDWTSSVFIAQKRNIIPEEVPIEDTKKVTSVTITCKKNKVIKKLTSESPKCPKGFKKVKNR